MTILEGWKRERHGKGRIGEVDFFRHKDHHGFVAIDKAQKGFFYYEQKKFYSVEISTMHHLQTHTFKTRKKALTFAKSWMRKNPHG